MFSPCFSFEMPPPACIRFFLSQRINKICLPVLTEHDSLDVSLWLPKCCKSYSLWENATWYVVSRKREPECVWGLGIVFFRDLLRQSIWAMLNFFTQPLHKQLVLLPLQYGYVSLHFVSNSQLQCKCSWFYFLNSFLVLLISACIHLLEQF